MDRTRRGFLGAGAFLGVGTLGIGGGFASDKSLKNHQWQGGKSPWAMCLDTATLSKEIPLDEKVELVAGAGFDAIEPWDGELEAYEKAGGSLEKLAARIKELGLFVPSVIGLWGVLSNSEEDFEKRLDEHRNRLRMVKAIGSGHVQCIPDFNFKDDFNMDSGAVCYARISEIALKDYGLKTGVIFLNAVGKLKTVADAVELGMKSGWNDAKIIPDSYHNYHGGTTLNSLRMLNGNAIAIYQFADAPKGQERKTSWCDGERVLPGDGQLPLVEELRILLEIGYQGCVSLELYNEEYRKREPKSFLKEAHKKTLKLIEKAVG
jgi:2-keto-myo-inositol isomerase